MPASNQQSKNDTEREDETGSCVVQGSHPNLQIDASARFGTACPVKLLRVLRTLPLPLTTKKERKSSKTHTTGTTMTITTTKPIRYAHHLRFRCAPHPLCLPGPARGLSSGWVRWSLVPLSDMVMGRPAISTVCRLAYTPPLRPCLVGSRRASVSVSGRAWRLKGRAVLCDENSPSVTSKGVSSGVPGRRKASRYVRLKRVMRAAMCGCLKKGGTLFCRTRVLLSRREG